MQGSYASLRSSGLLFDHCNPMELQQDDSYFKQSLQLGEQFEYMDIQSQYYEAPQDLVDQDFIARSARIQTDASAPLLGLGLSTSLFQNNGFRDNWRYQEALEGQQHSFGSSLQPSPAQCLSQGFEYPTQPAYHDDSSKIADCSDVEACKEDMTSSSTSPRIQSSPAMHVWPLAPEDVNSGFCSDNGMLTKDIQDDEEGPGDKPYARLIHEALMQAPGHRMMLREIYDWFVQNTTKPSESGTNGWQNSIRHNLSMNQVRAYS
jgi:Forkhead domain